MTVTDRIRNILSYSVNARNSDTELWLIYAQKSGMNLSQEQIRIFRDKMPSFETIRRVRQKLQEKGEFLASENVRKQRKAKAQVIQQIAPKAKPEYIERQLADGTIILPDGRRVLND